MKLTKLIAVVLLLPALSLAQVVPGTRLKSLKSTNPNNSSARTTKDGQPQTGPNAPHKPGDAHNASGASQKSESPKMKQNRTN